MEIIWRSTGEEHCIFNILFNILGCAVTRHAYYVLTKTARYSFSYPKRSYLDLNLIIIIRYSSRTRHRGRGYIWKLRSTSYYISRNLIVSPFRASESDRQEFKLSCCTILACFNYYQCSRTKL